MQSTEPLSPRQGTQIKRHFPKWERTLTCRLGITGSSLEEFRRASLRRHWLAMNRIWQTILKYELNPLTCSKRLLARLSRSHWLTVREACKLTHEQVKAGLRMAFQSLSKLVVKGASCVSKLYLYMSHVPSAMSASEPSASVESPPSLLPGDEPKASPPASRPPSGGLDPGALAQPYSGKAASEAGGWVGADAMDVWRLAFKRWKRGKPTSLARRFREL